MEPCNVHTTKHSNSRAFDKEAHLQWINTLTHSVAKKLASLWLYRNSDIITHEVTFQDLCSRTVTIGVQRQVALKHIALLNSESGNWKKRLLNLFNSNAYIRSMWLNRGTSTQLVVVLPTCTWSEHVSSIWNTELTIKPKMLLFWHSHTIAPY